MQKLEDPTHTPSHTSRARDVLGDCMSDIGMFQFNVAINQTRYIMETVILEREVT